MDWKRERIAVLAMAMLLGIPTVAAEESATEEAADGEESSSNDGPLENVEPEFIDDVHKEIRADPVGDAVDLLDGGIVEMGPPDPFDCVELTQSETGPGVPAPSFGPGSHDTPTWTWYGVYYDPNCIDDDL